MKHYNSKISPATCVISLPNAVTDSHIDINNRLPQPLFTDLIVNFKLLGFLKGHRLDTQVNGKIGRKIWTFSILKMTITQLLIGLET